MAERLSYHNGDKIGIFTYLFDIQTIKKECPKRPSYQRLVKFKCFCGKEFSADINRIKYGKVKSCGCSYTRIGQAKEGVLKTTGYYSWQSMKKRCYNKNCYAYKNYGGRGITVCDRWKDSYGNFLKDMGKRPSSDYTIERINNNGNYELSNCKWATRKEQAQNTRRTIKT